MTDHELLLAIADIMDKKLDSRLEPIENNILALQSQMQDMQDQIHDLRDDLQGQIYDLQGQTHDLRGEMNSMKSDLHNIKLFQENVILPRLNTIESCYTDTYKRYQTYADRMDSAFIDIDLLKNVVTEHSAKLQMIS